MAGERQDHEQIVWRDVPLYYSSQEHDSGIETYQQPATSATVYETYCPSLTPPQMVHHGWDSEDNEKKVTEQDLYFCRSHDQANYTDGMKLPYLNDTYSIYFFDDNEFLVSVSASKNALHDERILAYIRTKDNENMATIEYDPETGAPKIIQLPVPTTGSDESSEITYSLESNLYINRWSKTPIKNQTQQPEISRIDMNVLRITFRDVEGINQIITIPVSLKVDGANPFDQFTDLNSNDWVNPNLLEILHTFSSEKV